MYRTLASLDANGRMPVSQLPDAAATDAELVGFGRDRGSGSTPPSSDLRRGDVYLHTSWGLLVYGAGWRQTGPAELTSSLRAALTTATLWAGFEVAETDTGRSWRWSGSRWAFVGGKTPTVKVRRTSNSSVLTSGQWNGVPWEALVAGDTTETSMWVAGAPTRLIAPIDGLYLFSWAGPIYLAGSTLNAYAGARKNGDAATIVRGTSGVVQQGGGVGEQSASTVYKLAAGEYAEAVTYGSAIVGAQVEVGARAELTWIGDY